MPELSIVIACYNEERVLEESVREIDRVLEQIGCDYELIFVDDCSRDATRQIITRLCNENPRRRAILHEQNTGRGGAVTDGLRAAEGAYVGFLDIDLEVHARYIPSMVLALQDGADVASAYRTYKLQFNFDDVFRDILSLGYRRLVRRLLGVPLRDTEAGYKFFRREAILPILDRCRNRQWFWDTEIMTLAYCAGLTIVEIPCTFVRRWDCKSTVKPLRDSWDYFRALLKFRKRLKTETQSKQGR
ncbi:MAG: glycosyltransferase family 2 protein [bacterium]